MDNSNRTRICVCYIISALLISGFIYTIISINLRNMRTLERLREEVDEIAHLVLHTNPNSNSVTEPRELTEIVDAALKKRLAGIWDDIYSVKKQLKNNECMSVGKQQENSLGSTEDILLADRVNYASEDLGAKIYSVEAVPVGGTNIIKSILRLDYSANPPVNMLSSSMEPGNCFAFKESRADVTIKLAKQIFIESVEIAHLSKKLSPTSDISSAPRKFSVFGLSNKDLNIGTSLGSFEYDATKQIQEYPVKSRERFRYICFRFEENHGNPHYTCVYRVAVYGKME